MHATYKYALKTGTVTHEAGPVWLGKVPVPEHGHPVASEASSLPGCRTLDRCMIVGWGVVAWESVGSHIGHVYVMCDGDASRCSSARCVSSAFWPAERTERAVTVTHVQAV